MFREEFKGVTVNDIIDFLDRHKKMKNIQYDVRPEKAVLYALEIAEKINDVVIIYSGQMKWYLKTIVENGYNPFVSGKVVLPLTEDAYSDKRTITLLNNNKGYKLDRLLSLHITKNDLIDIIDNHFTTNPKVLIGHYNPEIKEEQIDGLANYMLLRKGVNYVE